MENKGELVVDKIVLTYMGLVSSRLTELGVSGEVSEKALFEAYQELRGMLNGRTNSEEHREQRTGDSENVYYI